MLRHNIKEEDQMNGYCTNCAAVIDTDNHIEPDAHGYKCPECKHLTLMGMEEALIRGLIDVDEEGLEEMFEMMDW